MGNSSHNISQMRNMGAFAGKQSDALHLVRRRARLQKRLSFTLTREDSTSSNSVKSISSSLRPLYQARCSLVVQQEP